MKRLLALLLLIPFAVDADGGFSISYRSMPSYVKDLSGEIFNAGTNEPHIVKNVIKMIYSKLNQLEKYKKIDKEFKKHLTTGEINYQYMNYDKLNKYFKWKPKTNLNMGILETIEWYQEYLNK